MKALVYRGPGLKAVEDRPKPAIQAPGDAIVKMAKTTICGTVLHILKGDVMKRKRWAVQSVDHASACRTDARR